MPVDQISSKVFVTAHVSEVYGPVQALIEYLTRRAKGFDVILQPLPHSTIRYWELMSYCGSSVVVKRGRTIGLPEPVCYIGHFLINIFTVLTSKKTYDVFIGIDNLNAIIGLILRMLGKVSKVVFYVIDYTPRRFNNPFLNTLYHLCDRLCVKNVDYIWNISERIADIRKRMGVAKSKNLVVPVGIQPGLVKYADPSNIKRETIVFVSHLVQSKGAQLAIEAMERVVGKVPKARLEIIGTGPYEQSLKRAVRSKKMDEYVVFKGVMGHQKLMQYLPSCGIGLATYMDEPKSISYFADPTKPKEYLACGLPVVITRVPSIASEIEQKRMGVAINYDKKELVNAILKLLKDDEFYERCKDNSKAFASQLSWDRIFDRAFHESLQMQSIDV